MKSILCIVICCLSYTLSAQDFYINLQTGYGFATEAGQANYYDVEDIDGDYVSEVVAGGFGEGAYFRANLGYNYSKLIAFEFGFNYLLGRTITTEGKYDNTIFVRTITETTVSRNIRAFLFTPQLVVQLPTESKLQPYVKTGVAIGTFMKSNYEIDFNSSNSFDETSIETDRILNGGTPFGFTAGLGAKYMINEQLSFITDFSLLNMSYRPYKSTVVKYFRDGVDEYNSLTLRERETLFNNKIEVDNNTMPDDNAANRALPISLPMSNVTFNVGLQLNL